jgi:predicted RND superfamily exporter protein
LLRSRYVAGVTVVLALIVLVLLDRHVRYEQSIQSFFSESDPDVKRYQAASDAFGNDNLIFIAYDDAALFTPEGMRRVGELAKAVSPESIDGVLEVQSLDRMPLFWRIDDELIRIENLPKFLRGGAIRVAKGLVKNLDPAQGGFTIGAAVRDAKSNADLEALAYRVTHHPLLQGTVVSGTGQATAVVVRLKSMAEVDPKAIVAALRDASDRFAERNQLRRPALVGPPVLLADGFSNIEADGRRLAVVGMFLIGVVTLTATRSLWWAVVPIVAGWTVWLITETVLATMNIKLSLSGGPLVAQIIVLTMPAASHLAIHFRDYLRKDPDRRGAAIETMNAVTSPILWCALTGTIGYGALLTSNVVPVRQFGMILAVCTMFAALLTLAISPIAMKPPFRLELPVRFGSDSRVARLLNGLTLWVIRHPAPIVVGVFALVLPLTLGIFQLSYESNYINAFQPETRVVEDYNFVETRLGGIGLVSLVVPVGAELDRNTVAKFAELDDVVTRIGEKPEFSKGRVTRVLSLATVLDPDGRLLDLDPAKGAEAIAMKLDLIRASPQAGLLRSFLNEEKEIGRVLVRIREQQSAGVKDATFVEAAAMARAIFGKESYLTGISYLLTQTTRGVIATQWTTFFWSAGGILLMLTVAFRGPLLAVLALLPTLLAVGFVLGLMGWSGVKLDIATALVASVALGLSVDDTFHCLIQFRRHRRMRDSFNDALIASYAITGPGVLLSSLAVAIGFAVLRLSEFVPFYNFGTMVGIATLGSSLGNLILLPACLTLGESLKSRFRRKRT